MVLEEEEITNQKLLESIQTLYQNRDSYIQAMEKSKQTDSIEQIVQLFEQTVNK